MVATSITTGRPSCSAAGSRYAKCSRMYIRGGFTRRYLSSVFTRSITTNSAAATASPIPMNVTYCRTR